MAPPPISPEDDRELLRLLIKEAVTDGMNAHIEKAHSELDKKLDDTRRQVWMGAGIVLAVSAFLSRVFN